MDGNCSLKVEGRTQQVHSRLSIYFLHSIEFVTTNVNRIANLTFVKVAWRINYINLDKTSLDIT